MTSTKMGYAFGFSPPMTAPGMRCPTCRRKNRSQHMGCPSGCVSDLSAKERRRRKSPSVQNYVTPWHLVRAIEDDSMRAPFALDACADEHNTKATTFYDVNANGLAQPWIDCTFYNPPYAEQSKWLEKAAREARRGIRSAGLLKFAPSESYWHPLVYELGTEDRYRGRIAFLAPRGGLRLVTAQGVRVIACGEPVKGSDFASALVLLGPGFRPRVVRYRDARTGRLIPPGHVVLEVRR